MSDTFDYIQMVDDNVAPTKKQQEECENANVIDLNVSYRSLEDWYCLLRKTQGDLSVYIDKIIPYMINGNDFLEDDIFCEWGYIIDLDHKSFDVYSMGNHLVASFDLLDLNEDDIIDLEHLDYE